MAKQDITRAANLVAEHHDSTVILYNGPINMDGFGQLLEALQVSETRPPRSHVLFILSTPGGLANPAYQIARTLQRGFKRFDLYVPAYCKSAGTLIALGANRIIMDDLSELGPLDVQLVQKDEIGRRRSGLILKNALEGLSQATLEAFERVMLGIKAGSGGVVSFETASRIAASIASEVMTPVYAQINPEALGNDLRDLNVATEYGVRLLGHSQNASHDCVHRLVHGYPSHDFIIDREEAAQLFRMVDSPDEKILDLTMQLGNMVYGASREPYVVRLDELEGNGNDLDDHTSADEGTDQIGDLDEGREDQGTGDTEDRGAAGS